MLLIMLFATPLSFLLMMTYCWALSLIIAICSSLAISENKKSNGSL